MERKKHIRINSLKRASSWCFCALSFFLITHYAFGQTAITVRYSICEFYGDTSYTLVELYYGVSSKQLTFNPDKSKPGEDAAAVEFTLNGALYGVQSPVKEQWRFLANKKSGEDASDFLVGTHSFMLKPGIYTFNITAVDTNARSHVDTITIPNVKITGDFASQGLHLSSIELGNSFRYAGPGEKSSFIKNGIEIIPNVLKYYDDKNLQLTYYAELYNIDHAVKTDSFRVETVVYDGDKNIYYDKFAVQKKTANSIVLTSTLPVESLTSSKYYLRICAFPSSNPTDNAGVVCGIADFYIDNSALPALIDPLNAPDAASSEFADKTSSALDTLFQEYSVIATPSEKDIFKQLTEAPAKAKFLFEFWKARNNDPDGKYTLKSYSTALDYVNSNFKTMFKQGWKTDRGRVYLQYGPPSRIDNTGISTTDNKPFIIWYYDGIEGGVEFDFVDENGYSDYKLENSTKRNELHDTNWQTHYSNALPGQTGQ